MKASKILELIKLPDGVEIDLSQLDLSAVELEWNRQYNGMVKSVGEEASTKATSELLSKYGLKSEEDIESLLDKTKTDETKSNEEVLAIKKELERLQTDLATKDAKLLKTEQLSQLRSLDLGDGKKASIKNDKLEYAHSLISAGVSEEKDFMTSAKEFISKTPEWLEGTKEPRVDLGTDTGDNEDKTAKVDDFW